MSMSQSQVNELSRYQACCGDALVSLWMQLQPRLMEDLYLPPPEIVLA